MSDAERFQVSKTVPVGAEALFGVLSDPARHRELDTSGMIRDLVSGDAVTAVGDRFVLDMNNGILGDYRIDNSVHRFEQGRTIGWEPSLVDPESHADKLGGVTPGGHTYTWELAPDGNDRTAVTVTYDWSTVGDPGFKKLCPIVNEQQLGESIDKLADVAG